MDKIIGTSAGDGTPVSYKDLPTPTYEDGKEIRLGDMVLLRGGESDFEIGRVASLSWRLMDDGSVYSEIEWVDVNGKRWSTATGAKMWRLSNGQALASRLGF